MAPKNTFVTNPSDGSLIYGRIPTIKFQRDYFCEGNIMLRVGEHIKANRGFGVRHIWAEHSKELIRMGYHSVDEVARYISDIINVGAPIFCEFNNLRGNHRIAVLRTSKGIVFLEKKYDGRNEVFYSVVTAFSSKKAHGTKIGNVC